MELLSYPKTAYLLDATLESLHKESVAWVKELEFWADEMAFFYRLLHHHKLSDIFPSAEVAEIDKALVKLSGESLDELKREVTKHERQLAVIFKSASLSEEHSYRDAHRKLLIAMHGLLEAIRIFKQKVFSFTEEQV